MHVRVSWFIVVSSDNFSLFLLFFVIASFFVILIEWEMFERLFENFHETTKETILRQWSDVGHYVSVCLGVYPSPTRIALKRIATCKGGCGSSKPLGIYRTPFQPCFGLPLPHCCLHRSTLSCTVQECNVTTYVLYPPSSWTFVFRGELCWNNIRK